MCREGMSTAPVHDPKRRKVSAVFSPFGAPGAPAPIGPVARTEHLDSVDGAAPQHATAVPRDLSAYGLPELAAHSYAAKGLRLLYEWQADCLSIEGVKEMSRSLVYSAPTSGGKTLVAELLMVKHVMRADIRAKALFVLPYISLVEEKERDLRSVFGPLRKRVKAFYSWRAPDLDWDVASCTFEKALQVVNLLHAKNQLMDLTCCVVDELHMIDDMHRGYLLEILLTKLKHHRNRELQQQPDAPKLQIVGMSATIPNVRDLANWLDAALFSTDFRPVSLESFIVVGNSVLHVPSFTETERAPSANAFEQLVGLATQAASVLVFCPTRRLCEITAKSVLERASQLSRGRRRGNNAAGGAQAASTLDITDLNGVSVNPAVRRARLELLEQLRQLPHTVPSILLAGVVCGVAFHHAGLASEEKQLLEQAFRARTLHMLTCTSTLAVGVNLPAETCIILGARVARKPLELAKYDHNLRIF